MKTLLFLLLSVTAFSQDLTYQSVGALQRIPYDDFQSYTTKNGEVFKIGDRIKIGQPSNGLYFNHIDTGDGVMTAMEPAGRSAAGQEIEIKRISVTGSKKFG